MYTAKHICNLHEPTLKPKIEKKGVVILPTMTLPIRKQNLKDSEIE